MKKTRLFRILLLGFFVVLSYTVTAQNVVLHQGTIYVQKGKNTTVSLPSYVISEYNYNSGVPYTGGGTITWSVSNSALVIATTGNFQCMVYPRNNGAGFPDYVTLTCQFYSWHGNSMIDYKVTWTVKLKEPDIPVTNIKIDKESLSICVNASHFLSYTVTPSNATDKSVSWTSSDKSIANVTRDGEVYGISKGTAIITCMANDGSRVKATCKVNVKLDGAEFRSNTIEGISMMFQVIDGEKKTCRVQKSAVNKSTQGTITIPSNINGYTVVEIGEEAFYECKGITAVSLPSSVTKIGSYAFCGCKSLSSITGTDQLEYIGTLGFYRTPFEDNLPSGANYIGKVLYTYKPTVPWTSLPNVDVKEGTTMISGLAFSDYSNSSYSTRIYIPKSVKYLGDGDNMYVKAFGEITISPDNPYFDSRNNCNAIIETASNCLIAACNSTVIPESVKSIGKNAFEHVSIGKTLTIPDRVDSIADGAFTYSYLQHISFGKSVRYIGENILNQCKSLEKISVAPENPYYDSRFDCNAVIETATNKLVIGCKNTIIPRTVTAIGDYAFYSSYAGVTSLVIPDNIEEIGYEALGNMEDLQTVTIGRGVKKMGEYIFGWNYSLKDIYILNENPISITDYTFVNYIFNGVTLHVPQGSYDKYRNASGWNKFVNIVEFTPTGINEISKEVKYENTTIYDLRGQRLAAPQKGINIIGGKKVIVR